MTLSNPDSMVSDASPNLAHKIASSVAFRLKLSLACDLASVRPACLSAVEFLAVQHVHPDHLGACELALVEACNNAILYARSDSLQFSIDIELVCQPPLLEMQIIDHTDGFDW